jgi:hypothetical protein
VWQCGVLWRKRPKQLIHSEASVQASSRKSPPRFLHKLLFSPRIVTITEPSTLVTDYLLAIAGITVAVLTYRLNSYHRAMPLWTLAFTSSALAATAGGTVHGFREYLGVSLSKWLWEMAMIFIGATAAFLIAATIISSLRRKEMLYVHWLKRGLIVSGIGFVVQKIGWDISPHFNHNDLYHLIQIVGFWCLFQGIKRIPEPTKL